MTGGSEEVEEALQAAVSIVTDLRMDPGGTAMERQKADWHSSTFYSNTGGNDK